MAFFVELSQSGGCDYTIECGTKVVCVAATTMEEAKAEIELMLEEKHLHPEGRIDSAIIYEVTQSCLVDTKKVYRDIDKRRTAQQRAEEDKAARAQLAALKKRFPNG